MTSLVNRIVFLNTTIVTTDGLYSCRTISHDDALEMLKVHADLPRVSAIGHDATAQVMTTLLGEAVQVNRIQYAQQHGDLALCFKIKGRIPEGQVLSVEQINEIGFEWKLLEKV